MKRIVILLAVLLILIASLPLSVFALDESLSVGYDIRNSSALEDLSRTYIDGKRFDSGDYPLIADADYMMLLNLVEYGYEADTSGYNLYFYVYNPGGHVVRSYGSHAIQLGLKENGSYHKLALSLVNRSADYRFLKFCLSSKNYGGKLLVDQLDPAKRSYFLSGIEIETIAKGPVDYKIAGSYVFTGYRSQNTLTCKRDQILTISLDLHSTFYRTPSSSKGVGYQNELDSVYFALDNYLMEYYGEVYAIHCSFVQKRVSAIVTADEEAYSAVIGYVAAGKPIDEYPGYSMGRLQALKYGFVGERVGDALAIYDWGFNCDVNPQVLTHGSLPSVLFYAADYDGDTRITGDQIAAFVERYGLSNDLLLDLEALKNDVGPFADPYHYKIWERDITIPVDQSFELLSYTNNHGWFSTLLDYGLFHGDLGEDITIDKAILPLDAVDFAGDDDFIASSLYVDASDVSELRAAVEAAEEEDQTVYLFRFNQQDYRSFPLHSVEYGDLSSTVSASENGFYAEMEIYEDFDVMDISFRDQNGIVTVLPVSSSAVDVYPDITPPEDSSGAEDLWDWLQGLAPSLFDEPELPGWVRVLAILAGVILLLFVVYFVFRLIRAGRDAFARSDRSSGSGGAGRRKRRK